MAPGEAGELGVSRRVWAAAGEEEEPRWEGWHRGSGQKQQSSTLKESKRAPFCSRGWSAGNKCWSEEGCCAVLSPSAQPVSSKTPRLTAEPPMALPRASLSGRSGRMSLLVDTDQTYRTWKGRLLPSKFFFQSLSCPGSCH